MAFIKPWALGAAACLALSLSGVSEADTLAAQPSFSRTTVAFAALKGYSGGTLTVAGPNGFAASATSNGGLPSLNLARFGAVPDGQYTYQLDAATGRLDASAAVLNNGRAKKNNVRPRQRRFPQRDISGEGRFDRHSRCGARLAGRQRPGSLRTGG